MSVRTDESIVAEKYGAIQLPLYFTPRRYPMTQGPRYINFSETYLRASRGFKKAEPLVMTSWQRWLLDSVFEVKPDGYWRYRQALIGLPRKNGKSLLGTLIALTILFFGDQGTQVYSAAATRDQAKVVFREAQLQVKANPWLRTRLTVYRDRIENHLTGSVYKPLAADASTAQGLGPSAVICDEVHAWPPGLAEEFWNAFTEASGDQPQSMVIGITTAGYNKETLLGELYKQGMNTLAPDCDDESFGMFWWGLPDDADIFDEKNWGIANPNIKEGLYDLGDLRSSLMSAVARGTLGKFKRYRLNQWVRSDGKEAFLTEGMWNKSLTTDQLAIEKGRRITVGFDGSNSEDSTGFVGIDVETGFVELLAYWEKDKDDPDWVVPRDEVNREAARIFEEYDVVKMWCDAAFYQTDVMAWSRLHRGRVERIPQSNARMIPLCGQLKVDLLSGATVHGPDPLLEKHYLNAVVNPHGKVSKEDPKSENKIDFLICSVLANGARNVQLGRTRKKSTGKQITLP